VHHRLTQVFSTGLAFPVPLGYFTRRAVIHDDIGVIDRDIGDALLEIAERIAARVHDLADDAVGLRDGTGRVVDELGLNAVPHLSKPRRLVAS